jgi:hypothetical protein
MRARNRAEEVGVADDAGAKELAATEPAPHRLGARGWALALGPKCELSRYRLRAEAFFTFAVAAGSIIFTEI